MSDRLSRAQGCRMILILTAIAWIVIGLAIKACVS